MAESSQIQPEVEAGSRQEKQSGPGRGHGRQHAGVSSDPARGQGRKAASMRVVKSIQRLRHLAGKGVGEWWSS